MDAEILMILVSDTLEEAGFLHAIDSGPMKRSGFSIKFMAENDAIAVYSETDNPKNYSRGMELALIGYEVTRPFSDRNVLKVRKP